MKQARNILLVHLDRRLSTDIDDNNTIKIDTLRIYALCKETDWLWHRQCNFHFMIKIQEKEESEDVNLDSAMCNYDDTMKYDCI